MCYQTHDKDPKNRPLWKVCGAGFDWMPYRASSVQEWSAPVLEFALRRTSGGPLKSAPGDVDVQRLVGWMALEFVPVLQDREEARQASAGGQRRARAHASDTSRI